MTPINGDDVFFPVGVFRWVAEKRRADMQLVFFASKEVCLVTLDTPESYNDRDYQ